MRTGVRTILAIGLALSVATAAQLVGGQAFRPAAAADAQPPAQLAAAEPDPWTPPRDYEIGGCFVCFAPDDRAFAAASAGGEVAVVEGRAAGEYRPGLLARIAYVLAKANVNVASAKINTLGERAEDVFLIDGARLYDEHALLRLETALYEQLRV